LRRPASALDTVGTLELMTKELPIACTLSGPDLRARLAEIQSLGSHALIEADGTPGHRLLRFRRSEEISTRLAGIVEAEAQCCAFLNLTIDEAPDSLSLTISGPEGSEAVVDELARAFAAQSHFD
jgi:hypothetical protein